VSIVPISGRVLYVEDNPAEVYLLQSVLTKDPAPFELTVLEDGEKALQFIQAKPFRPDVIVLDLNIPRVDGLTVLALLKADPSLKSVPVLVFASPGTPNSKLADDLKADLCLAKPFDLEGYRQLGDVIRDLHQTRSESVAAL
jgi:chemotaxis family two-component system response regulator Rcp1